MLKWIRGKRFDVKTTIILLLLAVAFWAVFSWARIKGFVPAEYRQLPESSAVGRFQDVSISSATGYGGCSPPHRRHLDAPRGVTAFRPAAALS